MRAHSGLLEPDAVKAARPVLRGPSHPRGAGATRLTDTATLRRYLAHDTSDHQPQPAPVNATTPNLTGRPDEVPTEWIALAAVLAAAAVGSAALWWAKRRRMSSATDAETHDRSVTTTPAAPSESSGAVEQR
jgi:hypothetical protein